MSHEFFLCYFETTRRCNLACPYCMSRTGVEDRGRELDTDEAKHLVLDGLAKFRPNAAVAFSGGEHLMRDDALELLRYAAEIGLFPFLNTNATMLDREMLVRIRDATGGRIVFAFPLNSMDATAMSGRGTMPRPPCCRPPSSARRSGPITSFSQRYPVRTCPRWPRR